MMERAMTMPLPVKHTAEDNEKYQKETMYLNLNESGYYLYNHQSV